MKQLDVRTPRRRLDVFYTERHPADDMVARVQWLMLCGLTAAEACKALGRWYRTGKLILT